MKAMVTRSGACGKTASGIGEGVVLADSRVAKAERGVGGDPTSAKAMAIQGGDGIGQLNCYLISSILLSSYEGYRPFQCKALAENPKKGIKVHFLGFLAVFSVLGFCCTGRGLAVFFAGLLAFAATAASRASRAHGAMAWAASMASSGAL